MCVCVCVLCWKIPDCARSGCGGNLGPIIFRSQHESCLYVNVYVQGCIIQFWSIRPFKAGSVRLRGIVWAAETTRTIITAARSVKFHAGWILALETLISPSQSPLALHHENQSVYTKADRNGWLYSKQQRIKFACVQLTGAIVTKKDAKLTVPKVNVLSPHMLSGKRYIHQAL